MRLLAILVVALAAALPAQATTGKTLRVDRPEKGAGATVTRVRLISGTVRHRSAGRVLTDTRCTPDGKGVSHCLNRIRLANGSTIVVVHDHRMATMPCLSPGEHVTLTPA
jgi:hypothetical protein